MFNTSLEQWTWISGNKTADEEGIYGEKGIPSPGNYPGARHDSGSWIDSEDNLWLFGGEGFSESGSEYLNDLWLFNTSSELWTWVNGSKTTTVNGVYGTGIPAIGNYPGSRKMMGSWIDSNDSLWLFGGDGFPSSGPNDLLNDLWKFYI